MEGEQQRLHAEQCRAYRAPHDMTCEICGKTYLKHPDTEHRDSSGAPYLNRLCNGDIVKL